MSLIGLDVGTTGCKAIVFDYSGRILGQGYREYGVICDAPGKAEQDAERVWALACEALREAAFRSNSKDIKALSISVQGDAIIPVDPNFHPLHNAILGMDYRSARQAKYCEETLGAEALFKQTGMRPHPMNSLIKALLLRDLAPKAFDQAFKIVTYADFVLGRLCGESLIDYTMASRTMGFDLASLEWSQPIHQALGLNRDIWSRPACSGTPAGRILPELAESLGLPSTLLVVTGGHDQTCAALGAGAVHPGRGVVSTGTAEVLSTPLPKPVLSQRVFDSFYPCYFHARKGMYFTFALNHCGGILLRWWRDHFASEEVLEANHQRLDPYQLIDDRMSSRPSPVMFLPHLNGSGTPLCDLQSKGAIVGITLSTTRHEIAQAILEGLTFELRLNIENMEQCGIDLQQLAAAGGGSKSARWLQMKADILKRPIRTLACREAACLGAAMLAGTAAGIYRTIDEAVEQTVRYDKEFIPNPEQVDAYEKRYSVYQEIYPSLRKLNEKL